MIPMTTRFLEELRTFLSPPRRWYDGLGGGGVNGLGRPLGEYEMTTPVYKWRTTDTIPVKWNLPCAVRYLLDTWEAEGRFSDVAEKGALRASVLAVLDARERDLWSITEHAEALALLDRVLGREVTM